MPISSSPSDRRSADRTVQRPAVYILLGLLGSFGLVWGTVLAGLAAAEPPGLPPAAPAPHSLAPSVLESGSLTFVPAEVAFYASQRRVGEQLAAFGKSRAFAALRRQWNHNPVIQRIISQAREEFSWPLDPRLFDLTAEEYRPWLELFEEAISQEFFICGDADWSDQLRLARQLHAVHRAARWEAITAGEDQDTLAPYRLLVALSDELDQLRVPGIVAGFRVENLQLAADRLDRLEQLARQLLPHEPEWLNPLRRKSIDDGDFLVWSLDGSLVPWDELLLPDFAHLGDLEEDLIARLQRKTLVVAVGIWRQYLLVSIGHDLSLPARLGGEPSLASRVEFERLRPRAQDPITSVVYASQPWCQALAHGDHPFHSARSTLRGMLDALHLNRNHHDRLAQCLERLFTELEHRLPRPGSYLSYSLLVPQGYESLCYQWGMERQWDAASPLSLLEHVGGEPIYWHVGRRGDTGMEYRRQVDWWEDFHQIAHEVALENLHGEELATYTRLRDRFVPLAQRLDRVHRELWGPAFPSRELAVVVDSRLTSRRPWKLQPESTRPLPLPELALVVPIHNPAAVKAGAAEYLDVAQSALNLLRRESPREVAPIELPRPARQTSPCGELFIYAPPEWLEADKQLGATAGLSNEVLVLTGTIPTAERLLAAKPIPRPGLLARTTEPLAAASSFDFPRMLDAVTPWAEFLSVAFTGEESEQEDPFDTDIQRFDVNSLEPRLVTISDELRPHLDELYKILKCFRGTRGITYRERDAWVTRREWLFSDLP